MQKNFLPMLNKNEFDYRVIRSARRRRTAFRFAPDGVLEILAPQTASDSQLRNLLDANKDIIADLQKRTPKRQPLSFEEGKMFMLLGQPYPLHLTHRLRIFDNAFMVPRGSDEAIRSSMIQLYRELALPIIRKRLLPLQEATGVSPQKIQISGANTRWGSCTSERHITFSWKLIQCPPECVDYVIVHELSHIKEMNHSAKFWQHVARIIPDFRKKRKYLNDFAAKLPVWD